MHGGRPVDQVEIIIRDNASHFDSRETIGVRARPAFDKGRPDWSQCHIEVAARRPHALTLPAEIAGVPVVTVAASLEEQARRVVGIGSKSFTEADLAIEWRTGILTGTVEAPRNYSKLTYKPFKPTKLREINKACELILHVSPDDGWPVLNDFLSEAKSYSVGIYDFTAPHLIDAFTAAAKTADKVILCVGPRESLVGSKKANDWREDDVIEHLKEHLENKLVFSWASTGAGGQFASAYHIKVAVKDRQVFWLSSGNWQSSNQPKEIFADSVSGPADGKGSAMAGYNREWHIIVKQPELAGIFEDYIIKDTESSAIDGASERAATSGIAPDFPADEEFVLEFKIQPSPMMAAIEAPRAHKRVFARKSLSSKPRSIMPLLTPDNYAEQTIELLRKAERRLWFQNQSLAINQYPSKAYRKLLDVLKEKAWEIDDCRIIVRDYRRANTIDYLRLLDRDGFPMQKVKGMGNCHTKGILVDGRWTLIGSHNWTNEGTNYNRDASLIIDDAEVTAYFEEIVDHDWKHVSYSIEYDLETPVAVLPFPGEAIDGVGEKIDARLNAIDDG